MSRLKCPSIGEVGKLGKRHASSSLALVSGPWFKITRSAAKSPQVAEQCYVNTHSLNSPVNRFPEYKIHPGYKYLTELLSRQVLSMPRSLLTHTALTEKNWFHYSARIWETVKKSTLFLEYNRLLP
ncbi:protein SMG9 [Trichonephila clavipes]|uniref:Protein SMG9 n=1 Tax=Trichonephila clavipes TaxID=2585209 RepID=A0A8X6R7V9_TRICX|nr:protein SMG9 [Trichonephila clavipes]